jgi:DNA repair protein RecO (recombination protein O)
MMPLKRATGIVIRSFDYGESDRIVTFFTLEHGKIKGIAKGARRSRRRFSNSLDLFCHVRIHFFEKEDRSLTRIDQCDVIEFYPGLSRDIVKMGYCSYFVELVDAMVGEGQAHQGLFDLLRAFLSIVDRMEPKEEMLRIFEIRLLSLLGYRPNLNSCTRCRKGLDQLEGIYFVPARGGIFCEKCCPTGADFLTLTMGTARVLEKLAGTDLSKIHRVRFSPRSLTESREILPRFIQHYLNRELKSLRFLESVRQGVPS